MDYIRNYWRQHKILSIVILCVTVTGGYAAVKKISTASAATKYTVTRARRGPLSTTVSGTGQVISNSQVDLKPKVNANVTAVYVRAGDRVKAGQVLFRLDATDAYKQVRDAKTSLESAQLSLEKLKNPKSTDVLSVTNSIQQAEDSKKDEDTKVANAHRTLLNANLEVVPEVAYTTEEAPTLSGSYVKDQEGQIKISVYQGGNTGYSFTYSGVANGSGEVNTTTAQPIGDTGLYIKWNSTSPQTNWVINIPNKQSSSYSSNYNAWQTAIATRETNNAATDRDIASLKQKLSDLTPDDTNLDVRSAQLQITQRENALEDAKQALSNYTITAPFDGVMAAVNVDIGASAVMASANGSASLGTIVTDKKLAQVTLNEADIIKVRLGQKANLTFDAIDGLEVEGTVVEINTLGTVTSGVVTYKAKISFTQDDPRILPNMNVSADIVTDSKEDVLYVPAQAVKHDNGGYYVEVEDASLFANASSSIGRFQNASSSGRTNFASSTRGFASSTRRNGASSFNGSSTGQRGRTGTPTGGALMETEVVPSRVNVTIGIQNDTQTEITSGLQGGEFVVTKKTTGTSSTGTAAPSITSLLRPQGRGGAAAGGVRTGGGAGGTFRTGQ